MTKNIRVTYSGLTGFLINGFTMVTGLIFILIVTRNLQPNELGTWGLIGSLLTYVIILEPIISYWTIREIARGMESGKTSFISSGLFSIFGIIGFLIISYLISGPTGTDLSVLFFASILIPFTFLNRTLSAIAIGSQPHINNLGVAIFDISKIPLAAIFILFFDLSLFGAILSTALANIPTIIFLSVKLRNELKSKFQKHYLIGWLKRGWLPPFVKLPNLVVFDVLIFSLITGSVNGIAYWVAANSIGNIVRHSGQISRAVYPKLLSGGKKEYLQSNFILFLYFSFPILMISIVFSKAGLYILNPIYADAYLIVIFISIRALLRQIGFTFTQAIEGIDEVDKKKSSIKEYLKSSLFYIPTFRLLRRFFYLTLVSIGLYVLLQYDASEMMLLTYWSAAFMIVEIPFTIYYIKMSRKDFPINLELKPIFKYFVLSIIIFSLVYLLLENFLVYDDSIFIFIPNLIPFLLLGILVYFGLTYLVDKKTRKLFKAVIHELKNIRK